MSKAMPEELFAVLKKAMERQSADSLLLSRIEEQRMELLLISYKTDKHIRAWLTVAMDAYAKAVVERKVDIFIDGFLHLTEMLFGGERR